MALIELRNIVKKFGAVEVLKNVSLTVQDGQFVSLLGPSGCGKTTLLHAIAGLIPIEGGTVTVDGELWSSDRVALAPDKRRVGMVFQDLALWPHMNVYKNIAFGLRLRGMRPDAIRDRVREVLEIVEMQDHFTSMVHRLSGGQRQRIAIARALALSPRLILMDEPLSALDARLRERMRWELREMMSKARMTTLYVTHDQMEALSMSDYVVLLNRGRIVQKGDPESLYNHPRTLFAADFMGAANIIQAQVRRSVGPQVQIVWANQALWASGGESLPAGTKVSVMIRPQALELASVQLGGRILEREPRGEVGYSRESDRLRSANWMGRVVLATFLGAHWHYLVDLMQHGRLEVISIERFVRGDEVRVRCPAGAARILREDPIEPLEN